MPVDDKTKFLRSQLPRYLKESRGVDLDKPYFRCLNPGHEDKNPSMSMEKGGKYVKCWSQCGRTFDIFDLEAMRQGIDVKTHFNDVKMAVERLLFPNGAPGFSNSTPSSKKPVPAAAKSSPEQGTDPLLIYESISTMKPQKQEAQVSDQPELPPKDFTKEHSQWHAHPDTAERWEAVRGISYSMVERFSLGYDYRRQALIVPCTDTYHAARLLEPRGRQKYDNPRIPNHVQLFNESALDGTNPVWIVEGAIDAISIIQAGQEYGAQAIATHSASNTSLVIDALKDRSQIPPLILCFDNDTAGKNNVAKLTEHFRAQNIAFLEVNFPHKGEDANSLLKDDAGALKRFICDSVSRVRSTIAKTVEKTSFRHHLTQYQIRKAPNIYLPTGFRALDKVINGGLHAGYLIVLGAQPSLGKTTLILQIANHIAEQGGLVIFFSLEQSINELLEKSISLRSGRMLTQNDVKKIAADNPNDPVDGDMDAKFEAFIKANDCIFGYSDNLHVIGREDAANTAQFSEQVFRLMCSTGKTPLVIIDHLQMVRPSNGARLDRRAEIDQIVDELIGMTGHFHIPTLVVSKLNRGMNDQDIRESGFMESNAIEYSADLSLALQFKVLEQYKTSKASENAGFDPDAEKQRNPREMQLKVLKQRGGEGGERIDFNYHAAYNEFEELDPSRKQRSGQDEPTFLTTGRKTAGGKNKSDNAL
jgi:replicative DNA helicase